jgi:hypothetical protein
MTRVMTCRVARCITPVSWYGAHRPVSMHIRRRRPEIVEHGWRKAYREDGSGCAGSRDV